MSAAGSRHVKHAAGSPAPPVIRVTSYDRVWSTLMALVAVLVASVWFLSLMWNSFQPHYAKHEQVIELIPDETSGGIEGGSPTDSLKLEGTGPERADATPGQSIADERPEVEEVLKNVSLESSSDAAGAVTSGSSDQLELDVAPVASFKGGKSLGTGTRAALGGGPGSRGGWPRQQRWYVNFAEQGSLDQYAQQLDFFGIELGALMEDHTISYISELSSQKPVLRQAASGEGEKRLFFTWQGGKRRQADVELFTRSGVPIGPDTIIFHFYPPATENMLALKERDYRNRPVRQIRRTFFTVMPADNGFDFEVTRQIYY
ncbi:MAG TPA: hypothetical protein VMR25_04810 [Planctomycetaceae bacterium]|jgi:hypothetical protein|nr:hypothetical protein [Planctomycetaceae bacterium]